MGNAFDKLRRYASTAVAMAREERVNLLVVIWRAAVAYRRYGMEISLMSYYGLAGRPPSEYGEFLTKTELLPTQIALTPKETRDLVKDKWHFHEACRELDIPTPPIWGCLTRDPDLVVEGVPRIENGADFLSAVSANEGERVIVKPQRGEFGRGVHRVRVLEGQLFDDAGAEIEPEALIDRVLADAEPYVVQPVLEPHESLLPLMPTRALGTVRIVTVRYAGAVSIVSACLKIPRGDSIIDNFQGGKGGNLVASIDVETGVMGPAIGPNPDDARLAVVLDRHPDTGAEIPGFHFPRWTEVRDMTRRAAELFPGLATSGWDVALTSDGPTVLEGNALYGIVLVQIADRRGYRTELMKHLERALTEVSRS